MIEGKITTACPQNFYTGQIKIDVTVKTLRNL